MIVVTGGAGFIGSNLLAGLEAEGLTDLVVCDTLGSDEKWRNIAKREIRDFIPPEKLFAYLDLHAQEIEAVFHIGAISSTTEKDADLVIQTNFTLSREIWKWCALHDVRLIYASSAATYGDGSAGFVDEQTPEFLSTLRPLNAYGWSKHVFDRRIARILESPEKSAAEKLPPQWAGLKFFNVYGPNEYHKAGQMSVACTIYRKYVSVGASAHLFKSCNPDYAHGEQLRDFVHVDDCVSVMLWLYRNPDVCGLFNVGTGKARSFNDLARAVFRAAGREPLISYMDMPEGLRKNGTVIAREKESEYRQCTLHSV